MNERTAALAELISYYRAQGVPDDQQMLIAMLREAQEIDGGALTDATLAHIAQAYSLKEAVLRALIRRVPSLRAAEAPHRLEICRTCKQSAALAAEIERAYNVQPGGVSVQGGFSLHTVNCMKNCRFGPSIRWDGELHGQADLALVRKLVGR